MDWKGGALQWYRGKVLKFEDGGEGRHLVRYDEDGEEHWSRRAVCVWFGWCEVAWCHAVVMVVVIAGVAFRCEHACCGVWCC